ncbi:glutathione S-transferase N-terminal domain-containing protein [Achromobacter xylosoxidans]
MRIALNLKRVEYRTVTHDLSQAEHRAPAYLTINPQGLLPALEDGDRILTQSLAIIEYLEARFPQPPLLPPDPAGAAQVRALFQVIAADTHALASMRVGAYLKQRLGHDDAQVRAWQHHWIGQSFDALETLLSRDPSTGEFSHGDRPSLADIALVPQAHTAVATAWSSGHGRRSPAFPTPACACRPSRRPTPIMC